MSTRPLLYFHHAGGLPIVPRGLRVAAQAASWDRIEGVPFERAAMGLTWASIEMLAALSIEAAASKLPGAVLYGHSMGGLVAFEVCRQLSSRGEPLPLALIVGATAAPGSLPPVAEVCERLGINPNDDSPAGVRVRAGIERARVYVPHPVSLDLDVHIVLGREDRLVPARARGAWARIGCERLHIHRVEGGHLFHQTPHECLSRLLISVSRLKVS